MVQAVVMAEAWRGPFLESLHRGHAVICNSDGEIIEVWGDPDKIILPRSSSKMFQALPLIESGAAKAFGLTSEQLALACASHQGAAIHTERVAEWLGNLDLTDDDLRCGPQDPPDRDAREGLIREGASPCQIHNNCSGKHSGFLTVTKHLGAGPDYVDPSHPVQIMVRDAFEDMTGEVSPGYGIDGCSAPNFASSLKGFATALARMAGARADGSSVREKASAQLVAAMMKHPELVAGEGRACTELMRAMGGRVALKTGAEAVFAAIIPEKKLGIAVKIEDGGTRGAECAIAALLVRLGVLDAEHPATRKRLNAPIENRAGIETGYLKVGAGFPS